MLRKHKIFSDSHKINLDRSTPPNHENTRKGKNHKKKKKSALQISVLVFFSNLYIFLCLRTFKHFFYGTD